MYAATRSAAVRQLARRSPTTSTTRSFAMQHSSTRSSACPVTPALRTAVAATLLVSFVYLASHQDALDQAVAPRSGLHYSSHHHHQSYSASANSTASPSPAPSPSFAALPSLSSTPRVASLGGGLQHELRMAGVFGRSLGA